MKRSLALFALLLCCSKSPTTGEHGAASAGQGGASGGGGGAGGNAVDAGMDVRPTCPPAPNPGIGICANPLADCPVMTP
ncbi:MAG TPA: hypothetical protein VFB99_16880, partial [Vicinamibacterales bacterium]|nr:hypothetical protein [Vicinamibacterales bacterium]